MTGTENIKQLNEFVYYISCMQLQIRGKLLNDYDVGFLPLGPAYKWMKMNA